MPPRPRPNLASVDRALAAVATVAIKSTRLELGEKRELGKLRAKALRSGRAGLTHPDRVRMAFLIRKAAPEKMPVWLRSLIDRLIGGGDPAPVAESDTPPVPRQLSDVDPLERLRKLGAVRDRLTQAQFEQQRNRIANAPEIESYGRASGTDPLDRIVVVGELEAEGTITAELAADITERILEADA